MRIADVLRGKGTQVATAGPTTTVVELLGLLAQYNVGALPVVDEDRLIGIVSERDVVRHLHDRGPDILGSQVTDVMVAEVVSCTPDDEAVSLARIMTDRRIRHIPLGRPERAEDVPADALALSRVKQSNKDGYAARLKARFKAAKEAKKK